MRLHLRLNGSAEALLTQLASKIDLKTRDIVLDALGVFSVAVRGAERGQTLGLMDRNGNFTAITTATLSALAETTQSSPDTQLDREDPVPV